MRGRLIIWIYYTLFSFVQVLSNFTGKVFNETVVSNPKEYCTLFSIFFHGVFLSKVLMRHILIIIQRGVL